MDDIQQEPQEVDIDLVSETASEEPEAIENDEADSPENEDAPEQESKGPLFDDAQQAKVDEIVGTKVAKLHEERRLREAAEARAAELEAKLPKEVAPDIPDMPDPYDEDYEKKVAERDAALVERARFDAQIKAREDEQAREAQRLIQEEAQRQQEVVDGYEANAKSFGIETEQMRKDAQMVSSYIPSAELESFVLNDTQGPLVVNYLASNPLELEKIRSMPTVIEAALYIANEIKPKIASSRKSTNAPKPVEIVDGNGAPEKVHPALKDAVWK